ncbi:hypothetical protein KKC13_08040 [bacterium]|nr:hypothetical protein [bacterium]MBU1958499.1 hypothetical protein [bacterium]
MKLIFFIMMTTAFLFSSNLSTLYTLYEKQEYDKACEYSVKYFEKNKNDDKYLTLYGLSCLETDKIFRIATPMIRLSQTEGARANASYFATILLQKQLLKQALLDGKTLDDLQLPKTSFILSKIFTLFVQKKYTLNNNIYKFQDESNKEKSYKLYMKEERKNKNYMIIDVYKDDKFIKRYRYN